MYAEIKLTEIKKSIFIFENLKYVTRKNDDEY